MRHILGITLVAVGATAIAAPLAQVEQIQQVQEVRIVTAEGAAGVGRGGATPMARGTGVVFGTAVEAGSNRPLSGAIVTLSLPGAQPIRIMTDGEGRFGFRDLPAGRFGIMITKPGFVDGAYGRTRPRGPTQAIALQADEKVSGVAIPLWRFGAITGVVVDEHGDPLVGVPVRALRRGIQSGRTQLIAGPMDTTDDRGIYRLGGLEPADYVVVVPMQRGASSDLPPVALDRLRAVEAEMVAVRGAVVAGGDFTFVSADGPGSAAGVDANGRALTYPTVFYPTAAAATQAQLVTIGSGDERAAIDFQLRAVPASTVSGTAIGPNGPAANLMITLTPADAKDLVTNVETITGRSDGQGRFTIPGVPAGRYMLRAALQPRMAAPGAQEVRVVQGGGVTVMRTMAGPMPLPTEPVYWAEMQLPVGDTDIENLTLSLQPGARVTGMVRFDGAAQRPEADALTSIPIMLEPAEVRPGLSAGRGVIEATGQFTTMGVPAGRYFLRVMGAPAGWSFQSASVSGRDASIEPIDLQSDVTGVIITFTDRPSELSGQVDTGGAEEAASVLAFPTNRALWEGYGSSPRNLVAVRADRDGKYSFQNLPIGEYHVVAVPDKDAGDWQDPRVLERLAPMAVRVRINAGDKVTQQLKVVR